MMLLTDPEHGILELDGEAQVDMELDGEVQLDMELDGEDQDMQELDGEDLDLELELELEVLGTEVTVQVGDKVNLLLLL